MLREALRLAARNNCDELACLGDITGYDSRFFQYESSRSAKECVELVRSNFRWVVAGNHDLFTSGRFPAWSDGFEYPPQWYEMDQARRKEISGGKVWCYEGDRPGDINENTRGFLKNIPEYAIASLPGMNIIFSHYFCPDFTGSTTRYVERRHQLKPHWKFMDENDIMISFTGHSHGHFAGFAYRRAGMLTRAIHSFPGNDFNLGKEKVVIVLPPLSGEKGRTGFSIFDTSAMKLSIIQTGQS
jgi:predicted phosphodiesterase